MTLVEIGWDDNDADDDDDGDDDDGDSITKQKERKEMAKRQLSSFLPSPLQPLLSPRQRPPPSWFTGLSNSVFPYRDSIYSIRA